MRTSAAIIRKHPASLFSCASLGLLQCRCPSVQHCLLLVLIPDGDIPPSVVGSFGTPWHLCGLWPWELEASTCSL